MDHSCKVKMNQKHGFQVPVLCCIKQPESQERIYYSPALAILESAMVTLFHHGTLVWRATQQAPTWVRLCSWGKWTFVVNSINATLRPSRNWVSAEHCMPYASSGEAAGATAGESETPPGLLPSSRHSLPSPLSPQERHFSPAQIMTAGLL